MPEPSTVPAAAEAPAAAPAPYAAGTGSTPLAQDAAAFAQLSYRERLALKRQDPEAYAALRG